ncbi:MAG: DUF6169 family protein [Arcicella sp.]|nr:DUF6169 family protein [Arcicella sp.]
MNLEEIQKNSYPFYFIGGQNNSYVFVTDSKISYEIKFKSSDYLFDNRLDFPVSAYEFVIEVAINDTNKKPATDSKMPFAIASIFMDFFQKNKEQVFVYICDSSDSRQEARRRKFNQWVELFKGDKFIKVDTKITESETIAYYNSILIRTDNPRISAIVNAFIDIANDYQK